jgi:hypothetical protein
MTEHRFVDRDEVVPTEIEHRCEELFVGDACEARYNYIIYHFDCDGAYFWARTYIGEINTVSVHGPFGGAPCQESDPGPFERRDVFLSQAPL